MNFIVTTIFYRKHKKKKNACIIKDPHTTYVFLSICNISSLYILSIDLAFTYFMMAIYYTSRWPHAVAGALFMAWHGTVHVTPQVFGFLKCIAFHEH
jgi:hypothetical protein